jgi:hypothetical protein
MVYIIFKTSLEKQVIKKESSRKDAETQREEGNLSVSNRGNLYLFDKNNNCSYNDISS